MTTTVTRRLLQEFEAERQAEERRELAQALLRRTAPLWSLRKLTDAERRAIGALVAAHYVKKAGTA